jgi:hypothetical protein
MRAVDGTHQAAVRVRDIEGLRGRLVLSDLVKRQGVGVK